MENSWRGNGKQIQQRYLFFLIMQILGFFIADFACLQVVSLKFVLIITSFLALYLGIFLYLYFSSTFVDQLRIDGKKIILEKDQSVVELPVDETKINQWPEVWGTGGSYLKYRGKRYFVGANFLNQSSVELQKLPGFSDLYLWIIYGVISLAFLTFFIYLVAFVIPSLG